ncbi:hypothetical protein DOY81_015443 [Sarcophaga bullata]|nr:hypothetical protein DOY81_015443 [Sarcophaga bullata]
MRSTMALYGSRRDITQAWDQTQERLQCCGVDTWHDWNLFWPNTGILLSGNFRWPTQGCLYVTSNFIRDHAAIIGGTSIAVAIIMIFGMVFSCLLFNMIE